jgi:2-polyprenyl-6-methoxyphenol hydroxylase-like FAD-dependent oxidoreductase
METEVTDLIRNAERVTGVRANTPQGVLAVRSDLVVGTDGRHSTVREKAGLKTVDLGAPMDVLWMRITRHPKDPAQTMGRIDAGRIFIMLDRGDYWQCAYVIRKGSYDEIRRNGLPALREELGRLAPFIGERVNELASWDDVKLLTVAADRLNQWHQPGLLCIGDAVHAMSPVGGVGINLAIQDAVATANILAAPLLRSAITVEELSKVQQRREWPTRMTQRLQAFAQDRIIGRVLVSRERPALPLVLRLMRRWPFLCRIPARLIGVGFRPEHVSTLDTGLVKSSAH